MVDILLSKIARQLLSHQKLGERNYKPTYMDMNNWFVGSAPVLGPSMNGLNHLGEQSTDTLIDKILEKMYALLIVQVQPKLLLELKGKSQSVTEK